MIHCYDNFLKDNELNGIKYDFRSIQSLLNREDDTGQAENKKSGKGWFVDSFICSKVTPNIYNLASKFEFSDKFSILVNEYENNDYYKEHSDDSIQTIVYCFQNDCDDFDGGELIVEHKIYEHQDNRCILFEGRKKHEVKPVKIKNGTRKTISIFYY